MQIALGLIPMFPLLGFAVLAAGGRRTSPRAVAAIGVGSIAASLAAAVVAVIQLATSSPEARPAAVSLWSWIDAGALSAAVSLSLDGLSAVMVLVVTTVGLLIHIYAAGYMRGDAGYRRFFAYMNLFVALMLVLVLADNLLLLYLGWEGVGLASYLLIGYWYREPANGRAARKAFIVTRVGDTAFAIGMFLLFWELGTVDIALLVDRAELAWPSGSAQATLAAALILAGAAGKSAQLPLHVWLPDAMAGPTPVSALIHAATMVTAGVYLIARLHPIFELAPAVLFAVALVGAATLLVGGASALCQRDIKRVLAYSTISQLGYMLLALGTGAYAAAIFHLITHAFFKSLLFLAAGVAIGSVGGEHDLARMGGLRGAVPLAFASFAIGAASLSALPLVTAGFYSKELIVWGAWISEPAGRWLAAAALAGSFLTALYAFRALFLAFAGTPRSAPTGAPKDLRIDAPLAILSGLALAAGLLETPAMLGGVSLVSGALEGPLPELAHGEGAASLALQLVAAVVALSGAALAYVAFARAPVRVDSVPGVPARAYRAAAAGFGFDALYARALVRPLSALSRALRRDPIDLVYEAVAVFARAVHGLLAWTQRGRVRVYLAALVVGALVLCGMAVLR